MFRTRALNYNSLPAAHSLFPDSKSIKIESSEAYFKYRLQNILRNPSIIQFVGVLVSCQLQNNAGASKLVNDVLHDWQNHVFDVVKDCEKAACRLKNKISDELLENNKKSIE